MAGSTEERVIRIGGASAFWGDSSVAGPQLVRRAKVDYLIFDYLAEVTMSILAKQRSRDENAGFATDFVTVAMREIVRDVAAQGIRVVANAGGVNPRACAQALGKVAEAAGVSLKIAIVEGDNLIDRADELRAAGVEEMFTGEAMPAGIMSMNAYIGGFPVARALARGADVVITGRAVDSALPLGILIHEFGWQADDYDRLSAGSLLGHIIECGAQATGGLHTDWDRVERWEDIGYPIAEARADGSFTLTKPAGTGGLIAPQCVAEQLVYEIGDPGAYFLPDVTCDFTHVRITQAGPDHVLVEGAKGLPPTDTYKVCATYADGYRLNAQVSIIGIDAVAKARRTGEAIIARTREIFRAGNLADYRDWRIETLGGEDVYGPNARAGGCREVVMRLAARHDDEKALNILSREIAPPGTSWSPGTTGAAGRQKPSPVVRLYSFLLAKDQVTLTVTMDDETEVVAVPTGGGFADDLRAPAEPQGGTVRPEGPTATVPLVALAWGRSGDKGDSANIGLIARDPAYLPVLRAQVTEAAVKAYFGHLVEGTVTRFELPGINGFNFLMERALGGGGMASLRNDPQGKAMAQMLLDLPIEVPKAWIAEGKLAA